MYVVKTKYDIGILVKIVRKNIFLYCLLQLFSIATIAQRCAANVDFENGNLGFWNCDTGNAVNAPDQLIMSGEIAGRHTVLRNNPNLKDPYGNFPINCPNGSGFSLQLGNNATRAQAEQVSYTFKIPENQPLYSLVYWYAVVFQNPDHAPNEQPKFNVSITDLTTGERIGCASFEYVVSKNLPGFEQSTTDRTVLFKSWTPVTVNLANRNNHEIKVSFSTADCTRGGHFGYAYVDIDTECGGPLKGAGYCSDVDSVVLAAPYGFEGYQWFTNDFQNLISNESRVVLRPPPAIGTKFSVILQPYSGYGCVDTLNTVIKKGYIPPFAIADQLICEGDSVLLSTGNNDPTFSYTWVPTLGIRAPDKFATFAAPKENIVYRLKVVDTASGCTKEAAIKIAVLNTSQSVAIRGDTIACGSTPFNVRLVVNPVSNIQWHYNGIAIPSQTDTLLRPFNPGSYHAVLTTAACTITTRSILLKNSPFPTANFFINNAEQCITGNNVRVTASDAGLFPVTREWKWGDGAIGKDSIANHQYQAAGNYSLSLKTISRDGCVDTISKPMIVNASPMPNFVMNNACEKNNIQFTNTTPPIAGSSISYTWHLGNSNTIYTTKDVSTNYADAGSYIITLNALSAQCPTPVEIKRRISISPAPKAMKKTIHTVIDLPTTLSTGNKGVQYKWTPSIYLNNDTLSTPIFNGNNSTSYWVNILSPEGCSTTDTVDVNSFKEITILVPTAFTPNGDGKNDRLIPILIGLNELQYFRVWNRWGNLIYESKSPQPGWDGTVNGIQQAPGTYVWEAYALGAGGIPVRKNGLITMLR